MEKKSYLFTSESVSEGHPDKICDQISDAVLDVCLEADPESRVACESFASQSTIIVGGEITTKTYVYLDELVHNIIRNIGYEDNFTVMNMIHRQSPDIDQGVSGTGNEVYKGQQGAGDQGMMFGYACNETPEFMPLPIMLAHRLLEHASKERKNGRLTSLLPDGKSQITVRYENDKPKYIDAVVFSHQHKDIYGNDYNLFRENIINELIKPVLEKTGLLDKMRTKFYVNPTGRFVIGGPYADTGLTGRKIIVDTYGGMGRHGGGAFSGKDPSKVDRSAAYMARYIAKNIVANELADRCEVQISYAIGVPFPVSVLVDTFGTNKVPEDRIEYAITQAYDLSPAGIIKELDLKKPIYRPTATYGHFGKEHFNWEKVSDKIKKYI